MAEIYPATLQETFTRGSFTRVPGNNLLFTETDSGPSKVRRRSTLRKDTIQGSILLRDNTEYAAFRTFYDTTLQDGVKSFFFSDPVDGSQLEVRFKEARWSLSDVGFQAYRVTMTLEVINE